MKCVSRDFKHTTPDTFLVQRRCAAWDIRHILPVSFSGGNFVPPYAHSWWERPKPNLGSRQACHCCFQRGLGTLDTLLSFETTALQRPKLGKISNI